MTGVRDFLIRSSEKIIRHHRLLLASAKTEDERELFRSRIEREERLVNQLRSGLSERSAA